MLRDACLSYPVTTPCSFDTLESKTARELVGNAGVLKALHYFLDSGLSIQIYMESQLLPAAVNGSGPDASKQSAGKSRQPIPMFKSKSQRDEAPLSSSKKQEPKLAAKAEARIDSVKEQSVFARLGSTVRTFQSSQKSCLCEANLAHVPSSLHVLWANGAIN